MQFRGLTKVLAINFREVGVGGGVAGVSSWSELICMLIASLN